MARHKEYENELLSKTIPPELHQCGYAGVADAVTYVALLDIVRGTQARLNRRVDGGKLKFSEDYTTAVRYLTSKNNILYRLDIPGAELAKKFISKAEEDWRRKHAD